MTRVEELAELIARAFHAFRPECECDMPNDSCAYYTWNDAAQEASRAALAWMAERVPHIEESEVSASTVVVPTHDSGWVHMDTIGRKVAECRALGGRCAWEEPR